MSACILVVAFLPIISTGSHCAAQSKCCDTADDYIIVNLLNNFQWFILPMNQITIVLALRNCVSCYIVLSHNYTWSKQIFKQGNYIELAALKHVLLSFYA